MVIDLKVVRGRGYKSSQPIIGKPDFISGRISVFLMNNVGYDLKTAGYKLHGYR